MGLILEILDSLKRLYYDTYLFYKFVSLERVIN